MQATKTATPAKSKSATPKPSVKLTRRTSKSDPAISPSTEGASAVAAHPSEGPLHQPANLAAQPASPGIVVGGANPFVGRKRPPPPSDVEKFPKQVTFKRKSRFVVQSLSPLLVEPMAKTNNKSVPQKTSPLKSINVECKESGDSPANSESACAAPATADFTSLLSSPETLAALQQTTKNTPPAPSIVASTEPDPMDTAEGFRSPKNTCNLSSLLMDCPRPFPTANRFEGLPVDASTSSAADASAHAAPSTGAIPKTRPPPRQTASKAATPPQPPARNVNPPIVLQGVPGNHQAFTAELTRHIKKGFTVKYAKNSTLVYILDKQDYDSYLRHLKNAGTVQFHTYASPDNKSHAFVLRGLAGDPSLDDIKDNLQDEHNLTVTKVYQLRNTTKPLYMIVTTSETTLKQLQTQVRYVLHTRVSWERRYNTRPIVQCRLCQMWGHSQGGCYRQPRCVKCAASHRSHLCPKPPDSPPKCANCGGDHTACNTDCPVYKFRLQQLETRTAKMPTSTPPPAAPLQPAPVPTTNAWTGAPRATVGGAIPPSAATSQPTSSGPPASSSGATASEFSSCLAALRNINTRINLSEAVKAVTALDQLLLNKTDPMDIVLTLHDFAINVLPQFHIFPVPP